jgi:predicted aspartyl protease
MVSRIVHAQLLLAAAWLPQAVSAADLAGPPSTVTFQLSFDKSKIAPQPILDADEGSYLVTEIELNGHRLPALLDTGSEITIVDPAVAKESGLTTRDQFDAIAVGGKKFHVLRADGARLAAGAFTRTGGWVGVADLSALEEMIPQHFSMILGADFLAQVALEVNRDAGSVTFLRSGTRPGGAFMTAPLGVSQPGNYFIIPLFIDRHPMDVRIDSGADDDVTIVASQWPQLVPPSAKTTDLALLGAGGIVVEPFVRLDSAAIGRVPVGGIEVTGTPDGVDTRSQGVIGMGVLSRFNLFLDARAGVIGLARTQKPAKRVEATMVGIQGHTTDQGLEIIHVMAHSPAQQAGLKDGDRICTVDGEQISPAWKGTPKGRWMLGPAGRVVTLGRCGGGSVEVTLRPFY